MTKFREKGTFGIIINSYLILFIAHIYRMIYFYNEYTVDISTALMISTIKF
jgi:hypothetical protein